MKGGLVMKKSMFIVLTTELTLTIFLTFGCSSSKVAKQKEALIEVHKPVIVNRTDKDNRPEWTTKEPYIEEDGYLIYTGGMIGGADYALTLRLAKSEATKNLLESIHIKARTEFSNAIHGQNRSETDLGRYVTDAVAWTVDSLRIGGIRQKEIYYEQVFDPANQSFKYNAWVQVQISKPDYLKAKIAATEKLLDRAIRQKDQEAKEKALELLDKLGQEA